MQKKILLLTAGIIIIIIFVVTIFVLGMGKKPPVSEPAPLSDNAEYSAPSYSFSHPIDIAVSSAPITPAGYSSNMKIDNDAHLEVQEYPASSISVAKLNSMQAAFGTPAIQVTVGPNGIKGQQYSHATKFGERVLQETVTVFESDGRTYKIQLTYPGVEKNTKYESINQKLVSSFVSK